MWPLIAEALDKTKDEDELWAVILFVLFILWIGGAFGGDGGSTRGSMRGRIKDPPTKPRPKFPPPSHRVPPRR